MNNQRKNSKKERTRSGTDTNVFSTSRKATIGRTTFLLERHFNGSSSLEKVIYGMVKNEAVRDRKSPKF